MGMSGFPLPIKPPVKHSVMEILSTASSNPNHLSKAAFRASVSFHSLHKVRITLQQRKPWQILNTYPEHRRDKTQSSLEVKTGL